MRRLSIAGLAVALTVTLGPSPSAAQVVVTGASLPANVRLLVRDEEGTPRANVPIEVVANGAANTVGRTAADGTHTLPPAVAQIVVGTIMQVAVLGEAAPTVLMFPNGRMPQACASGQECDVLGTFAWGVAAQLVLTLGPAASLLVTPERFGTLVGLAAGPALARSFELESNAVGVAALAILSAASLEYLMISAGAYRYGINDAALWNLHLSMGLIAASLMGDRMAPYLLIGLTARRFSYQPQGAPDAFVEWERGLLASAGLSYTWTPRLLSTAQIDATRIAGRWETALAVSLQWTFVPPFLPR